MSEISERVNQALEYAGKKQADFCKETGLARSSMSMICSGKQNPSNQTVKALSDFCKVRKEWIETGELPMEANLTNGAILAKQIIESGVEFTAISKQSFIERIDSLEEEEFIALANTVRKLFL